MLTQYSPPRPARPHKISAHSDVIKDCTDALNLMSSYTCDADCNGASAPLESSMVAIGAAFAFFSLKML